MLSWLDLILSSIFLKSSLIWVHRSILSSVIRAVASFKGSNLCVRWRLMPYTQLAHKALRSVWQYIVKTLLWSKHLIWELCPCIKLNIFMYLSNLSFFSVISWISLSRYIGKSYCYTFLRSDERLYLGRLPWLYLCSVAL